MPPPRISNITAWIVLLGGLAALLFFGLQTFGIRMETGDYFPEYSTYRADPKGLKAFYQSLEATDLIHVDRRLQSSKILPSGENRVLVLAGIQPDGVVSEEEAQFFDHWLATGGRLIVALRPEKVAKIHPAKDHSTPLTAQGAADQTSGLLWRNLIQRWGVEIAPLKDIHSVTVNSPFFGTLSRWLGRNLFDQLTSQWKTIALQDDNRVIVERAFEHGTLVLLADTYPLSNEALATDRNTDFLLWLIGNRRDVLFDETHLGLSEQPGIMTLAQRYGLQGTLVSIVAVLLLFIWNCQYTLVPKVKGDQNELSIPGCSSDQAFLNLLQRSVSRKELLNVCIDSWLKTARPTEEQLTILAQIRADCHGEKHAVSGYNQVATLLNEKL
jgi:hypothetical protein